MNMPAFEKGPSWTGPAIGAVVGSLLTIIGSVIAGNFTSQSSAEIIELREHDQKISHIEAVIPDMQGEITRALTLIGTDEDSQRKLTEIVINLKGATDETMRHTEALQKNYSDIRDALSPVPAPSRR